MFNLMSVRFLHRTGNGTIQKMRCVIVVPQDILSEGHETLLERRLLRVLKKPTGQSVLSAASVHTPDLIIFGCHLPDMDVATFCSSLAARADLRNTRLLMLTEEFASGAVDGSHQVDGHLICPVDPEELSHTVGTLLSLPVRRFQRVAVELLAQAQGLGEGGPEETLFVNVINISEGGARLEAETHLLVGAKGSLCFYLPDVRQRLTVPCTVRGLLDDLSLHYGVEFVGIGDNERVSLGGFVQRRLEEALRSEQGAVPHDV